jgi:probable H4MPT-linked C1 transfer pathway protein
MILGLDIGGANTKAASSDGAYVESIYLPLWKHAPLTERLSELAVRNNPRAVAVVMTGELADCFSTKLEGVLSIKAAVESSFSCPVYFWGVRGFSWDDPLELAAANWSASASLVAQDFGQGLFTDMGSTTTDLIPVTGHPLAGRTDLQRLMRGELIYTGMLRTSLGALLPEVMIKGCKVPTSPKFFAITADAYLALGEIQPSDYTCDAPDGGGKDLTSALRRLARTVCADLEELGEDGAIEISKQAKARQIYLLKRGIEWLCSAYDLDRVIAAGIGEGLLADATQTLGLDCILISARYGRKLSSVFPAYAVARLLEPKL